MENVKYSIFCLITRLVPLFFVFIVLTGCSDANTESGSGILKVGITDAPVDNAEVVSIHFSAAVLQNSKGEIRIPIIDPATNNEGRSINLLALHDGQWTEIFEQKIDSGIYDGIRLEMDMTKSFIQLNGRKHALLCTSCVSRTYKIEHNFKVKPDVELALMLDFDLRKSITEPVSGSSEFILRPSLRAVEIADSGSISGSVDLALLRKLGGSEGCAVYVFQNYHAQLDDVYLKRSSERGPGGHNNPISIAAISSDGKYNYKVSFLPAGQYSAAVTCEADMDLANSNDTLVFSKGVNISVSAGKPVNYNFVLADTVSP